MSETVTFTAPCPVCGNPAEWFQIAGSPSYRITCESCGPVVFPAVETKTKETA